MIRSLTIVVIVIFQSYSSFGQNYWHVGYVEGNPVILDVKTNKAFKVVQNLRLVSLNYEGEGNKIDFISDCGTLKIDKGNQLFLQRNNRSSQPLLQTASYFSSMSEDCKFIAACNSDLDSISIFSNERFVSKISGFSPQIFGTSLFFLHKIKKSGFVDVYRSNLSNLKERELILTDVLASELKIFCDGLFVACTVVTMGPKGGMATKAVYDTRAGKSKLLKEPKISDSAYYPIYFPKTKSLYYYNIDDCSFSNPVNYLE